jgi:acyl carrier protein
MELQKLDSNKERSGTARERVEAAVFRAIDTLNEMLAPTQQVGKAHDTVLVDTAGSLDSMAVVNLMVFIEDELAQSSGLQLDLTGADAFEQQDLKTLGSVIDALCRKLGG